MVREKINVFDINLFLPFRVQKDTTNRNKRRGKHSCVFAIKKEDANDNIVRKEQISVYWYSYSTKMMKTANVVQKNIPNFVNWLTRRDAPTVFQIDDDTFTLGNGEFHGPNHDPPLFRLLNGDYRLNDGSDSLIREYTCTNNECTKLNSFDVSNIKSDRLHHAVKKYHSDLRAHLPEVTGIRGERMHEIEARLSPRKP